MKAIIFIPDYHVDYMLTKEMVRSIISVETLRLLDKIYEKYSDITITNYTEFSNIVEKSNLDIFFYVENTKNIKLINTLSFNDGVFIFGENLIDDNDKSDDLEYIDVSANNIRLDLLEENKVNIKSHNKVSISIYENIIETETKIIEAINNYIKKSIVIDSLVLKDQDIKLSTLEIISEKLSDIKYLYINKRVNNYELFELLRIAENLKKRNSFAIILNIDILYYIMVADNLNLFKHLFDKLLANNVLVGITIYNNLKLIYKTKYMLTSYIGLLANRFYFLNIVWSESDPQQYSYSKTNQNYPKYIVNQSIYNYLSTRLV